MKLCFLLYYNRQTIVALPLVKSAISFCDNLGLYYLPPLLKAKRPEIMKDIADLLARFFVAFIFMYEAIDSIFYFSETKDTMTDYGFTWRQDLVLGMVIFVLILGAFLVAIGYLAKFGAFLLISYWISYTFVVYDFWNHPEELRRLHGLYFMRNMGVASALLLLIANGAGKYSIKRLIHVMRLPK